MFGSGFSGTHMRVLFAFATATLLTTVGSASAATVSATYTVADVYSSSSLPVFPTGAGNSPGISGELGGGTIANVSNYLSPTNFFTINPTGSCGKESSCKTSMSNPDPIQSGTITVTLNFTDTSTVGGFTDLTASLTETGLYQAKYGGTALSCTNSSAGDTDCFSWAGAPANKKSGSSYIYGSISDYVAFANGDEVEVTFINASDWSITPKIDFTYIACGGPGGLSCITNQLEETPLPGAVWLFGSVLSGAAGVGGWRRKKRKVAAAVAA